MTALAISNLFLVAAVVTLIFRVRALEAKEEQTERIIVGLANVVKDHDELMRIILKGDTAI